MHRHTPTCEKLPHYTLLQERYESGETAEALGREFGVSAHAIRARLSWSASDAEFSPPAGMIKCEGCGIRVYDRPNVAQALLGQTNHDGYCSVCVRTIPKDYHALLNVGAIGAYKTGIKRGAVI